MKMYELIADSLRKQGVETIFGLMGDQNLLYVSRFVESAGRFISSAHETGGVAAADGYARFGARVGVVTVTHGPAVTNALTSLTEAVRARSPIVVLTGRTPAMLGHSQDLDIAAAVTPLGAGYHTILKPGSAATDIARAFARARQERRPIVLDVPADMMHADVPSAVEPFPPLAPQRQAPDPDVLDLAAGLLASANRPMLLAGRGAITSDAIASVVKLAQQVGAAVATTLLAQGAFDGYSTDLGVCGTLSHDVAISEISHADVVLVFGASLNPKTTAYGDLFRGKRIIQVDVDESQFGRFTPVDIALLGDARGVADALCVLLASSDLSPSHRTNELAQRLSERSVLDFPQTERHDSLDARAAMHRVNAVLPRETTVVSDGGRFAYASMKYLKAQPGYFTHSAHFGSIGLSMSIAIGAAVALPDRLTLVVLGDGSFMMHLEAFNTAARHHLPLLVLVVNDGAYGAEYEKLRAAGRDPALSQFDWPDLATLAVGLGGQAVRVTALDEFDQLPDLLTDLVGPLLVDIRVDPTIDVANGAIH